MACFTPIFGKRIRITRLDDCGNFPAPGIEESVIVSDGFIAVRLASEIESATEILSKKADGTLCVNERTDPSFKYFTLEVDFCGVNTELLALMTNAEVYETSATDSGIVVPEGSIAKRFAFELWTGVTGAACAEGLSTASGYILLPFVSAGTMSDIEVTGENTVNFSMTGATTRGGNRWGVGPYGIMAGDTALPQAIDSKDHLLLIQPTGDVPAVPVDAEGNTVCSAQVMPPLPGGVAPAPAWQATTAYALGDRVTLTGGQILEATTAGTSGSTEPTAPGAVGGTVTDGTVTWTRRAA